MLAFFELVLGYILGFVFMIAIDKLLGISEDILDKGDINNEE